MTTTHTHSTAARDLTPGDVVVSPTGSTIVVEDVTPLAGSRGRVAIDWHTEGTGREWTQNVSESGTYAVMCSLDHDDIRIGVINGDMLNATTEPGEHVDWSTPDTYTASEFADMVGVDVATYAEQSPHMILFVIDDHATTVDSVTAAPTVVPNSKRGWSRLAGLALVTAATIALTAAPSNAAWSSQAETREANRIPASVKYVTGSYVYVDEGVRCFSGKASKTTRVQGVRVRKGWWVGYCNDGYVDVATGRGRFVRLISPSR